MTATKMGEIGPPTLPVEAWELVFDWLANPQDKASCSRVSGLWREALKPKRLLFLFHEVFPIIFRKLSKPDVLNLRLVCSPWKISVDTFLQRISPSRPEFHPDNDLIVDKYNELGDFDWNYYAKGHLNLVPDSYSQIFGVNHRITEFLEDSSTGGYSGENPFVTRHITIGMPFHCTSYRRILGFWPDNPKPLLEKYGRQVWSLAVYFHKDQTPMDLYAQLELYLTHMPHLKSLELISFIHSYSEENLQQVTTYMESHPLPEMEGLTKLKIRYMPNLLINILLSKCITPLETLDIFGPRAPPPMEAYDRRHYLCHPNLKEFYTVNARDLPVFQDVQWPLERLHLRFDYAHLYNLQEIIGKINQCGETLQEMVLNLYVVFMFEKPLQVGPVTCLDYQLNLPHLVKLKLDIYRVDFKTLDFLLPLKSLQKLIIRWQFIEKRDAVEKMLEDEDSKQVIQFNGFAGFNMYNSNIWEIFPKLDNLFVLISHRRVKWDWPYTKYFRWELQKEDRVPNKVILCKCCDDNERCSII